MAKVLPWTIASSAHIRFGELRSRSSIARREFKVQLLLGQAKIETTARHLGGEVDHALRLADQIELWAAIGPK